MSDETRRALAPLEFIVTAIGALLALALLLSVPAALFGSGSVAGLGEDQTCIETSVNRGTGLAEQPMAAILGAESGVSTVITLVRLCEATPSAWQRTLSIVRQSSQLVYVVGLVFLLWRLVRTARRGLFKARIATRVGRLGGFVLLGGVTVGLLQAWATSKLAATMVDAAAVPGPYEQLHGLAAPLLAGFGLLTLGRVLAQAVPMQHELDATV
jgi:hypothetical protein